MRKLAIALFLFACAGCASVHDRVPAARIGRIVNLPSHSECPGLFFASGHTPLRDRRGRRTIASGAELSFMGDGQLQDEHVDALAAAGPFDILYLHDCTLSPDALARLARSTQARHLSLGGPVCTRKVLRLFSEWDSLESAGFSIQGEPLREDDLAVLPGINELGLVAPPAHAWEEPTEGARIMGEADTRYLKHLPVTLQSLSLTFQLNWIPEDEGLPYPSRPPWSATPGLLQHLPVMPVLRSLSLSGARFMSAPDLSPLQRCPQFRSLDLGGCMFSTDGPSKFGDELRSLEGLRLLNLRWTNLNAAGTIEMLRGLRLHELELGYTPVAEVLPAIAQDLSELRHLDLEYTDCNDSTLDLLARLPAIQSINLDDCHDLSEEARSDFQSRRPDVHVSHKSMWD